MSNQQSKPASGAANRPLRLGIIYNAHSGRHRKRWAEPDLAEAPAISARTGDEIRDAVAEMAARGVELLAIAGGDGTVQAVLSHVMLGDLFEHKPLLALVPTGSTNMTANDVGAVHVRRDGWQPLQDWAQKPEFTRQRVTMRPIMKIQPGDHGQAFCGMFFGAGAIYHAVQHTQHNLHNFGLRGDVGPGLAFIRFVKAIATGNRRYFSPVHVHLADAAAGQNLNEDSILLLASTLDSLVLRLHPFWGTETGPLAWTAVADSAHAFLRRLPAICRGRRKSWMTSGNGYRSHRTPRLELIFDGGYIVDGEFFEACAADGPVVLSSAGEATFLSL